MKCFNSIYFFGLVCGVMKNKERKVDIRSEENLTTRFSTRRTIPIPQPKDYSRVMYVDTLSLLENTWQFLILYYYIN
jgi:hypothetical protein